MKRKERYKLLNHARKEYSQLFNRDYQFKRPSKKALYELLREYKHSEMCEWYYCCYGLYENCWQEPIHEGAWNYTQESVDEYIKEIIDGTAKICRRDSRILYCERDNMIDVIIVARDVCKVDYLITFSNEER